MLFSNPRKLLSEAAVADLLDPNVSEEVKDVIDDLDDALTNNIEEVKDGDKTTNGGIPTVTESVALMESSSNYGRARYLVKLEDVIAVQESEGEAEAAAEAEPGTAPTPEEAEAKEPDATDVVKDIADRNGVDEDQVAVVITAENVRFLAETALLEAKCGKKKGKGCKKLLKTKKAIDQLEGKVKLVKG